MGKVIMIANDFHDKNMLLAIAVDRGLARTRTFRNTASDRNTMVGYVERLAREAGAERIVHVYEASSQGFGLHDQLVDAGWESYILAPSKISRSPKQQKDKTDEKDARDLLAVLRGHILGGNDLPAIWIPDVGTRDDRELVRRRLDLQDTATQARNQIQSLLKRYSFAKPEVAGENWTQKHRAWLRGLVEDRVRLSEGAQAVLASLLRQLEALEEEVKLLEQAVEQLSRQPRYAGVVKELTREKGVGTLTAMTFLTEMGDLARFRNRRQIGAYLGVVPSCWESGEERDRKGHITHQGPWRVRKVLCQAAWTALRLDPAAKIYGLRLGRRGKPRKKVMVAVMRKMAIRLWRKGLPLQQRAAALRTGT
jgi:transposase